MERGELVVVRFGRTAGSTYIIDVEYLFRVSGINRTVKIDYLCVVSKRWIGRKKYILLCFVLPHQKLRFVLTFVHTCVIIYIRKASHSLDVAYIKNEQENTNHKNVASKNSRGRERDSEKEKERER